MNALTVISPAEQRLTSVNLFPADPPEQDSFGPLEWLVIAIGLRDGPESFKSRPLLDALGRLFACRQPNQLANHRLEQLRRMAALAGEFGWHVPPSEMAAFLRAGWSENQLELLVEHVSGSVIGN